MNLDLIKKIGNPTIHFIIIFVFAYIYIIYLEIMTILRVWIVIQHL